MGARPIRKLLLVEGNPGDARLLREMLGTRETEQTELTHVECMSDAEKHLAERPVDVTLLDLDLPDAQGLAAIRRAHAPAPRVPLVVVTGRDDEMLATEALQVGAQEYLIKGQIESRGLLRALRNSVERKTLEEALYLEKERAQVTLKSIGDAVACADISGNVTFLNAVAERMTGWSLREATGQPLSVVVHILDATSREGNLPASSVLLRRDGCTIPVEDSVAPIPDRQGQPTGSVIVFRDVSAARAMALQMAHAAQHDFLTGLPNRTLLSDRVSRAIALAERNEHKVAVLFLDLDGFKHINDSLGHPVGDMLLQSVATRLMGCLRGSDTVSRQGGDEFVVLLSEVEAAEDAALVARRMLQSVSDAHSIGTHDLHVTTSIGVSVYPDDGPDAEALIKNADIAMYQAKESGRQGFRFFTPEMNARAVERQALEEGLRRALERDELSLHYQPKVDLTTGQIAGVEALLRWTHPIRGAVHPAQFIPIAEDCGLIVPIGKWVLREACTQAQAWLAAGLPLGTMSVNVSAIELRDEQFLDSLIAILEETGMDPRALELELNETVLMKHAESKEVVLVALRALGVRLAVDDFGTGYSNLSYLRRFAVDTLKLDESFIRQIDAGQGETTIVAAVISMGRSLGLKLVAEGVETSEQLLFLRTHHCHEGQGYFLSRPIPAQELATLLEVGISEPS